MIQLRKWLFNNLGLKLISLALSILLWIQVGSREETVRVVTVPVEFVNLSMDLEISTDYQKEVDVVIRSQRRIGWEEAESRMSAEINLNDVEAGATILPLTERNIKNQPHGVEVVGITPARLRFDLEQVTSEMVEVQPRVIGKLSEGYELVVVRAWPEQVRVSGPASHVSKLSAIETEAVDIGDRSSSFDYNVYLDPQNPRIRVEHTAPVTLEIQIEEARRTFKFGNVPIKLEPRRKKVTVLTRKLQLVVSVPISFDGKLSSNDFYARIKTDSLPPQQTPHEVIPEIISTSRLEDTYRVESTEPELVRIKINR